MKPRGWILSTIFAAAILATVAIVGLRRTYSEQAPPEIVVVLKAVSPQMEFWQVVRQGIETAAAERAVTTRIVGPWLEQHVDEQIEILTRVIAGRPDGIVLAASDFHDLAEPVDAAIAADIPVVTLDSDVDHEGVVSFVGTNNVEAGRRAGRAMLARVSPGDAIAIVSHVPGVATAIERERGVREALESGGVEEIDGPSYALNDEARARRIVERLVGNGRPVAGIVALNETSTVGVGHALAELGFDGRVTVIGFDASTEEVSLLERGVVDALVVQKPFNMGYLSLKAITDTVRGESVAPRIDTGIEVVVRENMYEDDIQRLIFPLVR